MFGSYLCFLPKRFYAGKESSHSLSTGTDILENEIYFNGK